MSYTFPFKQGDTVIELGGGDKPSFRPNVDIRPGPTVDLVADLNNPLPLPDNAYNGVFSSYNLEHMSWRKVRGYMKECHRILAPGGSAVFVTANLLEQAKFILSKDEWTDNEVCCIFGDQNYIGDDWRANSHCCGFSPEFAIKLFREAGFDNVLIVPHGALGTDMIIEASKDKPEEYSHDHSVAESWTVEERKQGYNKDYFNGGGKFGGYAREGYWDYPIHWTTYEKIKAEKPESVLELGSARGYVLKRLEDEGIRVKGLEVSEHCVLTRVVDDIVQWDLTVTPWPIKDKEFDLVISMATLEHIPQDKIGIIARELERVSKRGLHGIDLGSHDDGFDKTHTTLRPKRWWMNHLPQTHKVVDKEDLEAGRAEPPKGDGKVKLNLGSFTTMFHNGWINMDVVDLNKWADGYGYNFRHHDVRAGLPYDNDVVDLVYTSHMLEHMPYKDGIKFLSECYRTMKPGATIRIIVPDAKILTQMYLDGKLNTLDEVNDGCADISLGANKLFALLMNNHSALYDADALCAALKVAGFSQVFPMSFRKSVSKQILSETLDMFPALSLYVDAIK